MNVTASEFQAYLEKFHSTLEDTATQHLPSEVVQQLFHLSFRPSGIRGYVSTQFGVAYEYVPSLTGIDVGTSSKRIEDFFLNTPARFHRLPIPKNPVIMLRDGAWNNTFTRLTCTNAPFPFHLKGPNTQLILIDCHFDGLGWSRDVVGAEIYGNRLASFWSLELAVGRAKDEVLAALVEVHKAAASNISLAEYINSKKQNTVLVLGDYSPEGCQRLESICECLTALGYQPVLVKDVPEILGAGLSQKVMVLGSIARFVLIDDSSKSGHLSEVQIALQGRWITILLHAHGQRGSFMTADASATSKVVRDQDYDPSSAISGVQAAITWAESQLGDLERKYKRLFPWREQITSGDLQPK